MAVPRKNPCALDPRLYPPPYDPCPCGSALKFKRCCFPTLSARIDLPSAVEAARKNSDHARSLLLCRAEVCRYVLWHRAHTATALARAPKNERLSELLEIDIAALADLGERLMRACMLAQQPLEFRDAIARLETAIDDPRWIKKVVYLRALGCLLLEHNRKAATACLLGLVDWMKLRDVGILQLGIDLLADTLDLAELLRAADLIIEISPDLDNRLQYTSVKALHLYISGDSTSPVALLSKVVDGVPDNTLHTMDTRSQYFLGQALMQLAQIESPKDATRHLDRALLAFQAALACPDVDSEGRALLHSVIAECHESADRLDKAAEHYVLALDDDDTFEGRYGLARVHLEQDALDDALYQISTMRRGPLSDPNRFDLAMLCGTVALMKRDVKLARDAVRELQGFSPPPLLHDRRAALVAKLDAMVLAPQAPPGARWTDVLHFLNRYSHIKPNLFGMGLNVNQIFDDLLKKSDLARKSRARDSSKPVQ